MTDLDERSIFIPHLVDEAKQAYDEAQRSTGQPEQASRLYVKAALLFEKAAALAHGRRVAGGSTPLPLINLDLTGWACAAWERAGVTENVVRLAKMKLANPKIPLRYRQLFQQFLSHQTMADAQKSATSP